MIETLVVGGVVLAVLVLGNLWLTFAIVGRVRTLQEMMNNQLILRDPLLPQKGETVGRFEATTMDGETFTDAALKEGKTLIGFFATGCRVCASVRKQLVESPPGMPLMAFIEGDPDDPDTLAVGASLKHMAKVALLSDGDSVTRAIKQAGYPTLVIVDKGVVAASGHYLHEVFS
ncbi:hypothetical protein JY651_11700 [Pyxidicoccus parkwayensis]|uniref:Thioredoxin domain-containing protein n=1 Tax=Pyxidicoccus parkwayensis TaxID=2813578 RepID=A0ABX7P4Z4_9BACT|nr:hypothetical protein [Pyxidicoccus parkwaysis]QSQ25549.1 hypothetical protein JY651_11700 [Pyxidicoccus parkwaysis]